MLALIATTFSTEDARAQVACSFTDDFERAAGNTVGNGWAESGGIASSIAIEFDGAGTYCKMERNNVSITQSLIDTTGLTSITFDYEWRDNGATDAGDSLIVQWKPSADETFITLATHVLTQATFLSESQALPAAAENTTIDIRFLTAVSSNPEGAHVENVAVCCPNADGDATCDADDACPNEPALVNPSEPGLEVTCADTIDNDCDGQTDAADSDCVFVDCNANGTNDSHDIFFGTSPDCDTSGAPDECEIEINLSDASGPLIPLGTSTPQSFTIVSAPVANGDVRLKFQATAKVSVAADNVTVDINGTVIGVVFVEEPVFYCQVPPSTDQIIVPAATYNAAVSGGDAVINMVPSVGVGDGDCNNQAFISVAVDYQVVAGLPDCNNNGTIDECELTSGTAQDCDTNGVPDDCQPDKDGDGAIDPCDACPYVCGDIDGTGTPVNLLDFAEFSLCFGLFGPDAQCDATTYACSNLNVDDTVNLLDFATLALLFGQRLTVSIPNCAGGP